MRDRNEEPHIPTPLKIGIAGAVGLGAVVTGMIWSRKGRRMVGETMRGRRRTTLEDRALEALWGDRLVGRRRLDVDEVEPGVLELSGQVRGEPEHVRVLKLVLESRGVKEVVDSLEVVDAPITPRERARERARGYRRRGAEQVRRQR